MRVCQIRNWREVNVNLPTYNVQTSTSFSQFQPATVEEITDLINTMPSKSCPLDPIPTWLLKRLTPHIAPVIRHLCNLSLHSGVFSYQTEAGVSPSTPEEE